MSRLVVGRPCESLLPKNNANARTQINVCHWQVLRYLKLVSKNFADL